MTLIEILLVIAIAAILGGGAILGTGAVSRTRLRTGAFKMSAAMRLAYVHALTTGRTTRLTFSLGGERISMEDTDDAHTLDPKDPFKAGGAADVQEEALETARLVADPRPRAPRASFRPVSRRTFNPETFGALEPGITVHRLYSQHETEPRTEGQGSVYFFPGGACERAVVQLKNTADEIFSVTLNPLTGRASVLDRPVEPTPDDDPDRNLTQDEIDNRDRDAVRDSAPEPTPPPQASPQPRSRRQSRPEDEE